MTTKNVSRKCPYGRKEMWGGMVKKVCAILLATVFVFPVMTPSDVMAKSTPVKSTNMAAKAVKVGKTASVEVAVTSSGAIEIAWKKAKKAKKYEIYRTASKNGKGKYTKIKDTTARRYTDKKVVAGKTYYYKVRGYRLDGKKKIRGDFSAVKTIKANRFPLIHRESMLTGAAISFSSDAFESFDERSLPCSVDGWHPVYVPVFTTYKEFTSFLDSSTVHAEVKKSLMKKYDKAFFKKSALMIVYGYYGSIDFKPQLDSLVRKNDEFCVGMTKLYTGNGIARDAAIFWQFFISIDKKAVADITQVSIFTK